jgi:hypothetical protein
MLRQPNSKLLRDRASDWRRIAEQATTQVGRHVAKVMAARYEELAVERRWPLPPLLTMRLSADLGRPNFSPRAGFVALRFWRVGKSGGLDAPQQRRIAGRC